MGFQEADKRNAVTNGLEEIELHLTRRFPQVTG